MFCALSAVEKEKKKKNRKVAGGAAASDRLEVLTSDPFNKVSHMTATTIRQ